MRNRGCVSLSDIVTIQEALDLQLLATAPCSRYSEIAATGTRLIGGERPTDRMHLLSTVRPAVRRREPDAGCGRSARRYPASRRPLPPRAVSARRWEGRETACRRA